jgi:hypothetical protein
MTRTCTELGLCQGHNPACTGCKREPQRFTLDDMRAGKPMPCAFCLPPATAWVPVKLEGPFRRPLVDWAAMRRAAQSTLRGLWRYLRGPSP